MFSNVQLSVIRFASEECARQHSGETSVANLVAAWNWALLNMTASNITSDQILTLGAIIEPNVNARGFRNQPASFATGQFAVDARHILTRLTRLVEFQNDLTASEFTKEFLDIHPFADGNGRTASILWNLLSASLDAPTEFPDFYGSSTTTI